MEEGGNCDSSPGTACASVGSVVAHKTSTHNQVPQHPLEPMVLKSVSLIPDAIWSQPRWGPLQVPQNATCRHKRP